MAIVVVLCVAISATESTVSPRISALLSTLAVLAALAVTLHWALERGGTP